MSASTPHDSVTPSDTETESAPRLVIDPATGRIVDANDAAGRWFGRPANELRGQALADLAPPATPGERVARDAAEAIAAAGGITEAHVARVALERSEARLRELLDGAADLVIETDINGVVTYANRAVLALTGLALEGVVGRPGRELMDPRDRAVAAAQAPRMLAGETVRFEARLRAADGSTRWIEIAGQRTTDGIESIGRDITERKALELERDRLLQALDQSQDLVVLTDVAGRTLYANHAFLRLRGVDAAEAIGTPVFAWFADEPDLEERVRETVRQRGWWAGDLHVRHHDGTSVVTSARISLVRDQAGEPAGVLGVATDVTRERAEAERMAEAARLEAIGQLAGDIAHDFNDLLTGVLGFAELVASAEPGDPELTADLAELVAAARRAEGLTRQLIQFGARTQLQPQVVDVADTVRDLAPSLRRIAGDGVAWSVEVDGPVAPVRVDPVMLEHALIGMVRRARDATAPGGAIRLRLAPPAPGDAAPVGDWTVIGVSDTGRPLDGDDETGPATPLQAAWQEGDALGIAMIRGLVAQSGGVLRLAPNADGTTVTIFLPVAQETPGPEPAEPAAAPAPPAPERLPRPVRPMILVVDDEAVLRAIAERVLNLAGFDVITAGSAEEALAVLAERGDTIDVLFTDVVMPGMHGLELAAIARASYPELRVLVTSGFTPDDVHRRGLSLTELPFLPKPYTPGDLTTAITGVLAGDEG